MNNTGIYLLAVAVGALALGGCSRETADWKSATKADTTEAYQQFLQQYPKSAESEQAQARIKQIADDRDWQAAAAADSRDAYEQYVAQHPDSKWAQEARIRIENFAQSGVAHGSSVAASAAGPAGAAGAGGAGADVAAGGPAASAAPPAPSAPISASAPPVAAARPATTAPHAHVAGGTTTTKVASAKGTAAKASGDAKKGHFVQLGAFHSKQGAESAWKKLEASYPGEFKSLKPHVVPGTSKHGPVYKLRVGVASASDAKSLCATMKKHAHACVPVTA